MNPIELLLGLGSKLIDRLWPDPAQAAQAKLELFKLQQSGELAQMTGQLEINKVEAASSSVFVSGWRPAIGWVCGLALGYQYLLRPLLTWGALLVDTSLPAMPGIDDNLWQLMFCLLGLGGYRTFEKVKGVASR